MSGLPTAAAAVTLDDVRAARARIGGRVLATPLVALDVLSRHVGATVLGKLETVQETGSFKVRGAWSHLLAREGGDGGPAAVAFSTGNHGRAVEHAARALGRNATVFVGGGTDADKVAALRAAGADVVV
ncbi:MAG: pyridoxal-phosphate dependent enzyme, partial [Solirubrobacteraceae bacterium]